MKRILFTLGCASALAAPAAAQSGPGATLGRPVANTPALLTPDVRPAAAIDFIPKAMQKGTVSEAPMLPPPGPMPPVPGIPPAIIATPPGGGPSLGMPGVYPGGPIPDGPVVVQPPVMNGPMPGAPMMGAPVPGGPMMMGAPTAGCGSPYGCGAVPGFGYDGMAMPMNRWYASGEYLVWWLKGYAVPPLISVGPVAGQGILGTPGTVAIFPDNHLENNPQSGGRFALGYWLSPKWALETNFFFIAPREAEFAANSAQYPNSILGRPFFSVNQNAEFVEQIGNPGIYSGGIDIRYKTGLYGLDLNARRHIYQSCTTTFDLLIGFRTLYLRDELTITENTLGLGRAPAQFVGQQRTLTDTFKTRNNFYGGQIGAAFERTWGRWSLNGQLKVALGQTEQKSDISGVIVGGATPSQPGGLLALNSNIGTSTHHQLAFVPELNLNLGYDVTPHLRVFAGYSFLYWNHVARPGAQIDRGLDEYRIPDFTTGRTPPVTSAIRPLSAVKDETFWAQGINFGLLFRW